jgi:hypothetical protein
MRTIIDCPLSDADPLATLTAGPDMTDQSLSLREFEVKDVQLSA